MNEYDITYEIFGKDVTVRVKASDLDTAWKQVSEMSILEVLKDKKLADFGMVYSGSSVEK